MDDAKESVLQERGARLKTTIKENYGFLGKFAKEMSISPFTLTKWCSGKVAVPEKRYEKICKLLRVSKHFLLTGEEEGAVEKRELQTVGSSESVMLRGAAWYLNRPVVKFPVNAGGHSNVLDGDHPTGFSDDYTLTSCPDANAFAGEVRGDSMLPDFTEGDEVIFAPNTQFKDKDLVYFRLVDGTTGFKQLFVLDGGYMEFKSLNPEDEMFSNPLRVHFKDITSICTLYSHTKKFS